MKPKTQFPPEEIIRPSAWVGEEMKNKTDEWITHLSAQEITELENAATRYLASGKDIGEMVKTDFVIPNSASRFEKLKSTLIDGIGFEVIRGLPISTWSQKLLITIFCCRCAHWGKARSQNASGHILGHVRDIGADANSPNSRIYQTSQRQTFHTDSADVVGLLCIQKAKQGGESLLVSTETIFNEMFRKSPTLTTLLFEPIATDRRGEVPEGEKEYFEIPVLNWYQGFLTGMYQRQYIDSAQRFPDALRLTDDHIKALDLFDQTANDPGLYLSMQLEPGDMQFVYNHSQLHDRTGFLDWPDPDNRRHLLRLWLSIEGDRPLPECFKQRYGSIKIGDRGGIITNKTRLHAPID